MTSNIDIAKIDEKLALVIQKESVMETDEYKELFKKAKAVFPREYEYFIHMACISYFEELNADKKI